MTRPFGVILAGGLATRMGGDDKALLPLGQGTLLDQVIDRLAPQVAGLVLNANGAPERFSEYDLPVRGDSIDGFVGPLAGVLAGMDWAAEQGGDSIVSVAADTPFFPTDLVARLQEAGQGMAPPLVLARTADGRQPTFGLWPVALRDDLRAALAGGLRKVVQWSDAHGGREAMFEDTTPPPFFNVNTPEDLEVARRVIEGRA